MVDVICCQVFCKGLQVCGYPGEHNETIHQIPNEEQGQRDRMFQPPRIRYSFRVEGTLSYTIRYSLTHFDFFLQRFTPKKLKRFPLNRKPLIRISTVLKRHRQYDGLVQGLESLAC